MRHRGIEWQKFLAIRALVNSIALQLQPSPTSAPLCLGLAGAVKVVALCCEWCSSHRLLCVCVFAQPHYHCAFLKSSHFRPHSPRLKKGPLLVFLVGLWATEVYVCVLWCKSSGCRLIGQREWAAGVFTLYPASPSQLAGARSDGLSLH